jgi:glycerophosphoryl diester phosphodiesterase
MLFTEWMLDPPIIAHRGASCLAPENTLAAFSKAYALGLQWFECDVMLSKDHEVVVIHDETVDRTTNGSGYVADYTYEELQRLDAGSWFHPQFIGEKIPLLRDVLRWLCQWPMGVNIEIKALPGQEVLTVKKVCDLIQCVQADIQRSLLLSSFSLNVLYAVRDYFAGRIGWLMDQWVVGWHKIANELHCASLHLDETIATPEIILEIHSTQRLVFCYTVNGVGQAQKLFSWGVDAIYSDCPDGILTLR